MKNSLCKKRGSVASRSGHESTFTAPPLTHKCVVPGGTYFPGVTRTVSFRPFRHSVSLQKREAGVIKKLTLETISFLSSRTSYEFANCYNYLVRS